MNPVTQSQPVPPAAAAAEKPLGIKPVPARPNHLVRRLVSYSLLALAFFLLGLLPAWVKAQDATARLSAAEQALRLAQIENALGAAALGAQQGDFAPALRAASAFYGALQAEIDLSEESAFTLDQRAAVQPVLAGRDTLIALLAREDPAAADRLSAVYQTYNDILAGQTTPRLDAREKAPRPAP